MKAAMMSSSPLDVSVGMDGVRFLTVLLTLRVRKGACARRAEGDSPRRPALSSRGA